jgi:hypothetical protein
MADIKLTCDEAPLDWPSNVKLNEIVPCNQCGLRLFSPQPGSLQISTRRSLNGCSAAAQAQFSLSKTAGAGDGVNIAENEQLVAAEYRGQKYNLEEVIFHSPGVHIFPNMAGIVYPAELHIHMKTLQNVKPVRFITIVVPVSHLIDGPGEDYFKAIRVQPDPSAVRPVLSSVLVPGAPILQYRGPDARGRTQETPKSDSCDSLEEREFLLVLGVAHIRATDLERIPREGSCSTDKRFMPAETIPHKNRTTVTRDRLLRVASFTSPGILGLGDAAGVAAPTPKKELECKPVKVVEGRDVIDVSGAYVDILTLLGLSDGLKAKAGSGDTNSSLLKFVVLFIGVFIGILIADAIFLQLFWKTYFTNQRSETWESTKLIWFLLFSYISARTIAATIDR